MVLTKPQGRTMTETQNHPNVEMRKVYTVITVQGEKRYRGYLHVPMHERLQDLLNDSRTFIPLHLTEDTNEVAILSKRFIIALEEISDKETKSFSFS
jgi:hypothetical protein